MTTTIDHEDTKRLVCPYCGYVIDDDWRDYDAHGPYDRESGRVTCPGCKHDYRYTSERCRAYTTYAYHGRAPSHVYVCSTCCDVCGASLAPYKLHPECPICGGVVCDKCDADRKPCCDEYCRWADDGYPREDA
jgi:hypothetical protein